MFIKLIRSLDEVASTFQNSNLYKFKKKEKSLKNICYSDLSIVGPAKSINNTFLNFNRFLATTVAWLTYMFECTGSISDADARKKLKLRSSPALIGEIVLSTKKLIIEIPSSTVNTK